MEGSLQSHPFSKGLGCSRLPLQAAVQKESKEDSPRPQKAAPPKELVLAEWLGACRLSPSLSPQRG